MENRYPTLQRTLFLLTFLLALASAAQAKDYDVAVSAINHDYRNMPVRVRIDTPENFAGVAVFEKDAILPSQARSVDGKVEVAWVVPDLKKGETIHFRLTPERVARPVPASGVIVDRVGTEDLDIRINNKFFTRYDTRTGPNKPYFYPIFGADDKRMTRRYGVETVAGESHDHPHHRGLWFTHGAVNGEDFWSEGDKTAKTVNKKYEEIQSGPVFGHFKAFTDWITHDGKKIAEDTRDITIFNMPDGRMLQFDITIKAVGGPLLFGDTKEGSFGMRLPDTMRVEGGMGHIEMSTGVKDKATWGKKAAWVDYYGPVDGETVGVAIFDHPSNLRHPTTWHVRDYGLFAANPFGLHDFNNDKDHPTAGDYTVKEGEAVTFRYLVYFHKGTTTEAHIADVWTNYTDGPKIEVR